MEFPDLGRHCSHTECKQLDFLPMKCDGCNEIFCKDHIRYAEHRCPESYKKNNQVPVCPLCNAPIPVKKGETSDYVVGQHIDNACQSDPARKKKKVPTDRCSKKGCKKKELIPFKCDTCHLNYCVKHRHEADHECKGFQGSGRGMSKAGAAAIFRTSTGFGQLRESNKKGRTATVQAPQRATIGSYFERERRDRVQAVQSRSSAGAVPDSSAAGYVQGDMSENEALAAALAASIADAQSKPNTISSSQQQQEEEDLALARALAESEQEAARYKQRAFLAKA